MKIAVKSVSCFKIKFSSNIIGKCELNCLYLVDRYALIVSLLQVMKESCHIAYTYAKSFLLEHFVDNLFLDKAHIHLHVPEVKRLLCNC